MTNVWRGKYLEMHDDDGWEYVSRVGGMSAVAIEAIIDGDILLVEQFRAPLGARCLEFPAGLIGDDDGGEDDTPEAAAIRELEEETGYRAGRIEYVGRFYSSPGMVSESFHLVRAHDLKKVGSGGGNDSEDIVVHRVPLGEVERFIQEKRDAGIAIDVRLMQFA
ncbi:NUDIX hydrolase [Sphingomicrobium marinum]|uniref:NUDIX hydrolase n=1 Tax=Sphingomicrobium marinum TaxID=1227950 RepID=UPI00223F33FE|nr:NUDIX hydrolase [Sphingomicrobium marinum]